MLGGLQFWKSAAASLAALFCFIAVAWAEVYDKAAPSWDPASGPMTGERDIAAFFASRWIWTFSALFAVLTLLGWRKFARAIYAVLIGWGILVFFQFGTDNEILAMDAQEGCFSGSSIGGSLSVLLAAAALIVSFVLAKSREAS